MANHPSALKRHRQSEKARLANRSVRARLRTMVRQLREAVAAQSRAIVPRESDAGIIAEPSLGLIDIMISFSIDVTASSPADLRGR